MDNKGNKQWVWLALDADTHEIIRFYIEAKDEAAAISCGTFATRLSPIRGCLYRILGSLCSRYSKQAASSGGQTDGQNKLH